MIVLVDPQAMPGDVDRTSLSTSLKEGGFTCDFVPQVVEKSISWYAHPGVKPEIRADIESESLVVLSADDAVKMLKAYHQHKAGSSAEGPTMMEWVESVQDAMPGKTITVFVIGMDHCYSNKKLSKQRAHREKVTGKPSKGRKKAGNHLDVTVTLEEAEEVFVDVQISTRCFIQHVDSTAGMVQEILRFSKAVMDKHKKKSRLDSGFSFTDNSGPGLSVNNRSGEGLIMVWKKQLTQFNNLGADMAEALVASYQSPSALVEACSSCYTSSDVERTIGDINVRRGTSIVATNRRIGKEHARRINTFMTSSNPDQVIK